MAAGFGISASGDTSRTRRTVRRHSGMPSMTERQTQAYLMARDAIRRIQRCSALAASTQGYAEIIGRTRATYRGDFSNS